MKPKPLHGFTPADLRAFGAGNKTQYRVPVKPQPKHPDLGYMAVEGGALQCGADYPDGDDDFVKCPLGKPGDRLFVSEPFRIESFGAGVAQIRYEADNARGKSAGNSDRGLPNRCGRVAATRMPAHCARYWCEIAAVRVERVAAISEADARAEGVSVEGVGKPSSPMRIHQRAFKIYWNARHGAGAWERNDWCWCLTLKKVEGAK